LLSNEIIWEVFKGVFMKKTFLIGSFFVFAIHVLIGCASTIPMSANLNDFVMLGIKTNNGVTVSYEFYSQVTD
jgi:hypothetical protein